MRTFLVSLAVIAVFGCTGTFETPDRFPPDHPAPTVESSAAIFTLDLANMCRGEPVVRFVVRLDGDLLVEQRVPYSENPVAERFPLALSLGAHDLTISVDQGSVRAVLDVGGETPRFVGAMYWCHDNEDLDGSPIELVFSDEPFAYG